MLDALLWPALALAVAPLLVLAWLTVRRFRRARRGERALLDSRRRVLWGYRARRDGRAYHPDRNPEVARLFDRDRPP